MEGNSLEFETKFMESNFGAKISLIMQIVYILERFSALFPEKDIKVKLLLLLLLLII